MSRLKDLDRFYRQLKTISDRIAGPKILGSFSEYNALPIRGAYFFFEAHEVRHESGEGPRVVRVGTHAVKAFSKSTLGKRLRQHRGHTSGGGNHRASIFRLLVGQALMAKGELTASASWGRGSDLLKAAASSGLQRSAMIASDAKIEEAVTQYIAAMPFLWLDVSDEPGPDSLRGYVERNAIALLSNHGRAPLDGASPEWLGRFSNRPLVRSSGLWNQRHVEDKHDPAFLDTMDRLIADNEDFHHGKVRSLA